jgi:hypothetical protein
MLYFKFNIQNYMLYLKNFSNKIKHNKIYDFKKYFK